MQKLKNFVKNPYLLYVLLIPVYLFASVLISQYIQDIIISPSVFISAKSDISEVKLGDDILVSYKIARNRSCQVHIQRIAKNTDFGFEVILHETARYLKKNPSNEIEQPTVSVTIPNNIPKGNYEYFTLNTYVCDTYHKLTNGRLIKSPSIKIKII